METKKRKLLYLIGIGNYKKALIIAKRFFIDFTKDEQCKIQIASECFSGYGNIYKQIGVNCEDVINEAILILKTYYKNNKLTT